MAALEVSFCPLKKKTSTYNFKLIFNQCYPAGLGAVGCVGFGVVGVWHLTALTFIVGWNFRCKLSSLLEEDSHGWRDGRWSCCQRMWSAHLITCGCLPPERPFSNNDILILLVELGLYIHLEVTLVFLWSLLIRPLSFSSFCLLSTVSWWGFSLTRCTFAGRTLPTSWTASSTASWRTTPAWWSSSSCCPPPTQTGQIMHSVPLESGICEDLLSWHRNLTVELVEKRMIPGHQISTHFLG